MLPVLVLLAWAIVMPEVRAETAVTIQNSSYEPKDLVVLAGDTVVWTNNDTAGHTVTADDEAYDSHPQCGDGGACLMKGDTFQQTFDKRGKYLYYCRLHGGPDGTDMAGTVTVLG
jgi:plastocyanin